MLSIAVDHISPHALEEGLCVAFLRHVELTSTGTDNAGHGHYERCMRILQRFDTSWSVHRAMKCAARVTPQDEDGSRRDGRLTGLTSYSITFAVLSAAHCMWRSCAADAACSFLAHVMQESAHCPIAVTEPLAPGDQPLSGRGIADPTLWNKFCHDVQRASLFMDILPSDLMGRLDTHPQDPPPSPSSFPAVPNGVDVDVGVVWASFVFLLLTGQSLGTTLLINNVDFQTTDFSPDVDWFVYSTSTYCC